MKTRLNSKGACLLLSWIFLVPAVIAKGPPPDLMISVDGPNGPVMIFNSVDEMELHGSHALGTVLLAENEVVTFQVGWNYPMQSADLVGEDSTWTYSNFWYGTSLSSPVSVGPIGELRISLWGLDWGYDVDLVIAIADTDPHPVLVKPIVVLSGALREADPYAMATDLCINGLLPITEPYTAMGWMTAGSGGETASSEVLEPQEYANNNVVDWMLLELRDVQDPSIVVASKCGLLHGNGLVTAEDGISPVTLMAPYGNYYLAVRHRNHLGIMSAEPFNAMSLPTTKYLNYPAFVHGTNALCEYSPGRFGLWPGNSALDASEQVIKYAGLSNDRDPILQRIGGNAPTATTAGYHVEDVNLDGVVKYAGANNDRDIILQSIGGNVPTAVRTEQLPY
jgi:hypothetical protein